ncbi:carbohydrate ABC transporter permease [Salisediminibacterium selenitireducens]|uniref:Binding-protein-dependent transport systems inner membrane component n=1 Tax=Bacillus selenitireducens (strain ATCC 700615 / DSM 15326 / MLS10) TaxID=439292 RepID=D6Y1C1_BACIE|nr:carbohydrate ABC transporter permease [Salisediminibacterium selenitireducens]ADI00708.1 binding-protein-dependent transport systems inner membrane component [[Bacillus] selenitireducens MLS10]
MLNKTILSSKFWIYVAAYGLAAIMILPLLWMIISSFKPPGSTVTVIGQLLSSPFSLDSYRAVLRPDGTAMMWQWTFNSVLVGVVQTVVTVFFASWAAFAVSRIPFRGKKFLFAFILIGLMVPVESIVVPLFNMIVDLNWVNTYHALIWPGMLLPLAFLILKQFIDQLPGELLEAAKIDGAGYFTMWAKIILPLSRSSMAAVSIFVFIQSWNNLLWPLLVAQETRMMTLPVGIPTFQSNFATDLAVPMASNVLASIPALIVFLLFQKHIIKGIALSGIK